MPKVFGIFLMTKNSALTSAISFFVTLWLAGVLGPLEFGKFNYVMVLASIVMVFTIFGTDQTSAFLKNKGNDLGSIFIYTHSIRCLSGVCVYIGLVIIFGLNSEYSLYLLALLIPNYTFGYLYELLNKQVRFSYIQSAERAFYLLMVVTMLMHEKVTIDRIFLCYAIASISSLLFQVFDLRKQLFNKHRSSYKSVFYIIRVNTPLVVSSLIALQYGTLSRLFLANNLGEAALGIYSASWQLTLIATVYHSQITRLWRPEMANAIANSNYIKFRQLLFGYFCYAIIPIIAAAIFVASFGPALMIRVLGPEYQQSEIIIRYAAVYFPIISFAALIDLIWVSTGKTFLYLCFNAVFALASLSILWAFSYSFDAKDFALLTVFSHLTASVVLSCVICWVDLRKRFTDLKH